MSTATVKAFLDDVAEIIASSEKMEASAKAQLLAARNQLATIPTQYSAEITEVQGYTPTGAVEIFQQDLATKLTANYGTLKTALEAELTALSVSYT